MKYYKHKQRQHQNYACYVRKKIGEEIERLKVRRELFFKQIRSNKLYMLLAFRYSIYSTFGFVQNIINTIRKSIGGYFFVTLSVNQYSIPLVYLYPAAYRLTSSSSTWWSGGYDQTTSTTRSQRTHSPSTGVPRWPRRRPCCTSSCTLPRKYCTTNRPRWGRLWTNISPITGWVWGQVNLNTEFKTVD